MTTKRVHDFFFPVHKVHTVSWHVSAHAVTQTVKRERRAERQLVLEHPSSSLSNMSFPQGKQRLMKLSIQLQGPFLCPAVCLFVCACFREKKSHVVSPPLWENNHITAAQRRWAGRGQGSHRQVLTTAHQSVLAQTPQASYSQASESRTTLQNKTKRKAKRLDGRKENVKDKSRAPATPHSTVLLFPIRKRNS